jgi:hypothetical protein
MIGHVGRAGHVCRAEHGGKAWRQNRAGQCRHGGMAWHSIRAAGYGERHFGRAGHSRVGHCVTAGVGQGRIWREGRARLQGK